MLVVVKVEGCLRDQLLNNRFQIAVFAHTTMGPKPYISKDKISRIYALYKTGFGTKAIVEQTGVAQHTMERWLARCSVSTSDTLPKLLPKFGQPRKCSPKTVNVLKRQIKISPSKTAREFK